MIHGIDVGTSQRFLNWSAASSSGVRVCYVKLGGDNAGRYVAPYYRAEVDGSRSQGFITGHYWVTGGDPTSAAHYYVDNLSLGEGDFFVLDNEKLDSGAMYSDQEAAVWFQTVQNRLGVPTSSLFMYIGAADLRTRSWPECESLGVRLIVASYGSNSGYRDHEPYLGGRFGGVWAGHQYTSQGYIDGVVVDLNVFQEWAFSYDGIDDKEFLMGLSQFDQEYTRNNTVEAVETLRRLESAVASIQSRFAVPGMPFDWFPALNNNIGSVFAAVQAIAKTQGVELDEAAVASISSQVSAGVQAAITDAVKSAIIEALPDDKDLTKEDVVDAIRSVTFTAQ